MNRFVLLLAASATLAGCATPPKPLRGTFAPLAPEQAASTGRSGDSVRWGGRIVAVEPTPEHTCFEVLGRDLGDSARPVRSADQSQGRFIACRTGFYDPAIFTTERDITVTGTITGFETRRIGEYDYRYPRVAAEVIYLWPELSQDRIYYSDPFWPGYSGYWGYRYPPVLIRPVPRPKTAPETPPPAK